MVKFTEANEKKIKKIAIWLFPLALGLLLLLYLWNKAFTEAISERNNAFVQIAVSEAELYFHELKFFTENKSKYFSDLDDPDNKQIMKDFTTEDIRIQDMYLVNRQGLIIHSLDDSSGWLAETADILPNQSRIWLTKENNSETKIFVASPIIEKDQQKGLLVISFFTQDFLKRILHIYSGDNFKIAFIYQNGHPLLWPFSQTSFDQDKNQAVLDGKTYTINKITLEEPWVKLFVFQKKHSPWLPFLILPALIVVTMVSGVSCFFYCRRDKEKPLFKEINFYEKLDLNDFNELNIGMIFADDKDRIQFANKRVRNFFQGKKIIAGKTFFSQLLPNLIRPRGRLTIQAGHQVVKVRHYVIGIGTDSPGSVILFTFKSVTSYNNE